MWSECFGSECLLTLRGTSLGGGLTVGGFGNEMGKSSYVPVVSFVSVVV